MATVGVEVLPLQAMVTCAVGNKNSRCCSETARCRLSLLYADKRHAVARRCVVWSRTYPETSLLLQRLIDQQAQQCMQQTFIAAVRLSVCLSVCRIDSFLPGRSRSVHDSFWSVT